MASLNRPADHSVKTHEGAPAVANLTAEQMLRRSVMSCLLWEDQFYEDGQEIAARIGEYARKVSPIYLASLAKEVRHDANLRHAPLLLLDILSESHKDKRLGDIPPSIIGDTIREVISRPDELTEFLAIYWRNGRKTVSHQIRKGLAEAFEKFNEYSLAKYDRGGAIKLRDVLRICHPKPATEERAELYKKVRDRTLATPDTWEVALSGGADKKATFERMLTEGTLGYMALMRNLRNMEQAGVNPDLVNAALIARKRGADKVLPFRYVAAARAAPRYEPALDESMIASMESMPKFKGKTAIMVDVSASMEVTMSGKSDLKRVDAAAALAALFPADRKDVRTFTFSNRVEEVPTRLGMSGIDAIIRSQSHQGTRLGEALKHLVGMELDRVIVITDEQSHDRVGGSNLPNSYMINVASYRNGVGYGNGWRHIDGWSDNVFSWMHEIESNK